METQDIQKGRKVSQKFVFLLEVYMFVICDFSQRLFSKIIKGKLTFLLDKSLQY